MLTLHLVPSLLPFLPRQTLLSTTRTGAPRYEAFLCPRSPEALCGAEGKRQAQLRLLGMGGQVDALTLQGQPWALVCDMPQGAFE